MNHMLIQKSYIFRQLSILNEWAFVHHGSGLSKQIGELLHVLQMYRPRLNYISPEIGRGEGECRLSFCSSCLNLPEIKPQMEERGGFKQP